MVQGEGTICATDYEYDMITHEEIRTVQKRVWSTRVTTGFQLQKRDFGLHWELMIPLTTLYATFSFNDKDICEFNLRNLSVSFLPNEFFRRQFNPHSLN